MKRATILTLLLSLSVGAVSAEDLKLKSPNGKLALTFTCEDSGIAWQLQRSKKHPLIEESQLGLSFLNAPSLGRNFEIIDSKYREVDQTWIDNLGKRREVTDQYSELYVYLKERCFPGRELGISFRAYNEGVAFRYHLPERTALIGKTIIGESSEFNLAGTKKIWAPTYASLATAQEAEYLPYYLEDIDPDAVLGLPVVSEIEEEKNYIVITEANIRDWCGFYLGRKDRSDNTLSIRLPQRAGSAGVNAVGESPRGQRVKLSGECYSPWRVVMVAENPGELHESSIIKNLNEPSKIEDTSWIKPGVCVWDNWWSNNARMNTESIKEFIDFAADNGFEYQLIDWRWYGAYNNPKADITSPDPSIDMQYLISYAKERNVGIWLWVHYNDFVRQSEVAFDTYQKWGVAGVKIDFMNREDQTMVNWYEQTLEDAVAHHLMVNFHGAYKPDGLSRTYPNLMTREGVLGNEYNKNSCRVTPDHNVMLSYTRALIGAMDYTPGGFLNSKYDEFMISNPTMVQGSRAHQLALFTIYESPLTTLCDTPKNYKDQVGLDFIKQVSTVWEETVFVDGEFGEYICIARKDDKGDWIVSAITNSNARKIRIDLDFLSRGKYSMVEYRDDESNYCNALRGEDKSIRRGNSLKVELAPGGGYVAILKKL